MINQSRIEYLLQRWMDRRISPEEQQELVAALNTDSFQELLVQYIDQQVDEVSQTSQEQEKVLSGILQIDKDPYPIIKTAHRIHFLKTAWFRYAAAVVICFGVVAYFMINNKENRDDRHITQVTTNVAPGSNKAILSIGNDQTINLSGDKTGITVGSTITYNDGEQIADAGQVLQLSTPRGGQYQAVLPDGSKVWLNAASSIKFPSAFNDKERKVEVTGEAYFEITKDVNRPFKVDGGGQEIEVLGTSFNINIYADESTRKTTLITGSIKITNNNQTAILKPGQQANISNLEISKIHLIQVQTNDVLAWKNGLFNFEGLPLSSVMKQLERWYDIETKYDEKTAKLIFRGELYRNLPLKNALEILKDMGIKYELNGKTLTILGATW